MATAAEPRPAALPLPGGREGATVRLHPLLTGTMTAPPAWLLREEGRRGRLRGLGIGVPAGDWVRIPVVAFLVEHPSAGALLVDTGFHSSVAVRPAENLGALSRLTARSIEMRPEQAVAAQLRARGIDPGRISVVVMTHLHKDHASGISDFPQATFVLSSREWEAATSFRGDLAGQLHGYVRRQFDHAFDYRMLDFDSAAAGSFASFGRSFDLFGDGSVRVVSTPGHTHGHLSVVLRLAGREALLCGDAAYTLRTLDESRPPVRVADEHRFRRSLREIQLYREQTPAALIVPGHDLEHWRTLKPVYA